MVQFVFVWYDLGYVDWFFWFCVFELGLFDLVVGLFDDGVVYEFGLYGVCCIGVVFVWICWFVGCGLVVGFCYVLQLVVGCELV